MNFVGVGPGNSRVCPREDKNTSKYKGSKWKLMKL